jgi:uncharacterized protein YukE
MAGVLNYPPDFPQEATRMQAAARGLNDLMDDLRRAVNGLAGAQRGAANDALVQVENLWRQTGLGHNDALRGVAKASNDSFNDINALDAHVANQLR